VVPSLGRNAPDLAALLDVGEGDRIFTDQVWRGGLLGLDQVGLDVQLGIDQAGDGLGVGVESKHVTLGTKFAAQIRVVCRDDVARHARVRKSIAGLSLRGPASVGDADRGSDTHGKNHQIRNTTG
jgi:hypothetical protein